MRNSEFFLSFVKHIRYFPGSYEFDYRYFWAKLDLDEIDGLVDENPFLSRNRFNLFSFYDRDHIFLGHQTLKENILQFLRDHGVTEKVLRIELIANLRIFGYTFNPVSFYVIHTETAPRLIIEIGNTFGEQKPYLVPATDLKNDEWVYRTQKQFYISPFTSVENHLVVKMRLKNSHLRINIDDFTKDGKLEVKAIVSGSAVPWTTSQMLKLVARFPFVTLRIICAIHYHALRLWLMKVPYWKKTDNPHLQTNLFAKKHGYFISTASGKE